MKEKKHDRQMYFIREKKLKKKNQNGNQNQNFNWKLTGFWK